MLAKEHKITIEEGNSWAANIKKRQVFYRKEDIYNLEEEHILGLLLHEIAHIHYTGDVTMPQKNQELLHSTLNMLEDIAIEHRISQDYPNAGEILDQTRTECLDTLVKMLPKMKRVSLHEKSLLYAATRFDGRGYEFNLSDYEKIGDAVSKVMIARKSEILDRINTKDLLPLAQDIANMIIKEAGEPSEQEKHDMQQNGMHGQASENTQQDGIKKGIIQKLKAGRGWIEGQPTNEKIGYIDKIADQASTIGKQLRTVLKRNNAMEFGGRYRTGKLLPKRFVRIKVMKDRNPFARRIVKSNQSYAFAIASDVSGSMYGIYQQDNASYAMSSMHMVAEALRMANVPRSLTIFGNAAVTIAPMGKQQINWSQMTDLQFIKKARDGGTQIDKAIEECVNQLKKIRAERKIMIVLTDGQSYLGSMQEAHKKAIQEGIECIGIEIGADHIGTYMDLTFGEKRNIKIKDSSNHAEIGKAFINILKTSITKSP